MPIYHRLGKIPAKRHTQFRNGEGKLYNEELFGTIGFNGMSLLLYHIHRPTILKEILSETNVAPKIAIEKSITSRLLKGFETSPEVDFLESRKAVLINNDLHISLVAPSQSMETYFYKNADADELLFVHKTHGY